MRIIKDDKLMKYDIFDSDELLALSRNDMLLQNYELALEKIKTLIARESIPLEVLSLAGKIYATLGLFEKAKSSFSEYLQHAPNAYIELFQLGMVERDLGEINAAVSIWMSVLDLEPNYPDALYYCADAYIQLDLYDKARANLLTLLETAPDDSKYIPMADQLLNRIKAH